MSTVSITKINRKIYILKKKKFRTLSPKGYNKPHFYTRHFKLHQKKKSIKSHSHIVGILKGRITTPFLCYCVFLY